MEAQGDPSSSSRVVDNAPFAPDYGEEDLASPRDIGDIPRSLSVCRPGEENIDADVPDVPARPREPSLPVPESQGDPEPEGESEKWRSRKKHVFILNASGRPVFSRYGDESSFSELFGVLQLLCSIAAVSKSDPPPSSPADSSAPQKPPTRDVLRSISTDGDMKIHFLHQQELIYVMVTKTREETCNCIQQLQLLHTHFLSVLPSVNKILTQHPNYDVRRYFAQADVNSMKSLIHRLNNNPTYYFRALQATALPLSMRSDIDGILLGCRGSEEHLYTFLLYGEQVVSCVSPQGHPLHVDDILVLQNYTSCVAVAQGQAWVPMCLPKFNDTGYMWCYVARLADLVESSEDEPTSAYGPLLLVQLATSQDQFSCLSEVANTAAGLLHKRGFAMQIGQCAETTLLPIDTSVCGPAGAELQFFLFVTGNSQMISSQYPPQMANSKSERKRIFRLLLKLRASLQSSSVAKDQLLFFSTPKERILVSLAPTVNGVNSSRTGATIASSSRCGSLYMVFLPCTAYDKMSDCADRLIRWLKSKDEDIFITRAPHWS